MDNVAVTIPPSQNAPAKGAPSLIEMSFRLRREAVADGKRPMLFHVQRDAAIESVYRYWKVSPDPADDKEQVMDFFDHMDYASRRMEADKAVTQLMFGRINLWLGTPCVIVDDQPDPVTLDTSDPTPA